MFIDQAQRSKRAQQAMASEICRLRSVGWNFGMAIQPNIQTCRPDLRFAVNQLQWAQNHARVQHLIDDNELLHDAMADKEKGIFFAKVDFRIEDTMILSINDARHAASFVDAGKTVAGHRCRSGRILALLSNSSRPWQGLQCLLEWSSTCIKRVCRSTLQAELSLCCMEMKVQTVSNRCSM